MTFVDRFLRQWRTKVASRYIRPNDRILDIGCFDGYLFKSLKTKPIGPSVGLDPLLSDNKAFNGHILISGKIPDDIPNNLKVNNVVMLAVLEHLPKDQQQILNNEFKKLLEPGGRVIITVPSPFVDKILAVLLKLRLIDGMSLDEHYGFEVEDVYNIFNINDFKLLIHKKFQLGLNNLFVFEKCST